MESVATNKPFPNELKERAVAMVLEWRRERGRTDGGLNEVGEKLGVHPDDDKPIVAGFSGHVFGERTRDWVDFYSHLFGFSVLPISWAGLLLILGVDTFLDMGRSATNAIGNSIASAAVAKWEGELLTPEAAEKNARTLDTAPEPAAA